ncbi:MAG: hypothetical protein ACI8WB_004480 [Phenylobacterium sp.]|jgi:hypothetical protein
MSEYQVGILVEESSMVRGLGKSQAQYNGYKFKKKKHAQT